MNRFVLLALAFTILFAAALGHSDTTRVYASTKGFEVDDGTQDSPTPAIQAKKRALLYKKTPGFIRSINFEISGLFTDLVGNNIEGVSSPRPDFGAGLTIDFGRSTFEFETGLTYRQLGTNINLLYLPFFGSVNAAYNLNYIGVPLYAKYFFNEPTQSTIYLKGGLIPQLLVKGSVLVTYENTWVQTAGTEAFNSFGLDAAAIIGGKFMVSDFNEMFIEGGYSRGLVPYTSGTNIYNSYLFITVGFGLGL